MNWIWEHNEFQPKKYPVNWLTIRITVSGSKQPIEVEGQKTVFDFILNFHERPLTDLRQSGIRQHLSKFENQTFADRNENYNIDPSSQKSAQSDYAEMKCSKLQSHFMKSISIHCNPPCIAEPCGWKTNTCNDTSYIAIIADRTTAVWPQS